jgi:hypothetical protein
MYRILSIALGLCVVIALPLGAQPNQLRAALYGSGNSTEGKCLIEVVVFGAADLEIRGDNAVLRNTSGQRPEGRRFECTARVPDYPIDLRVRSIAGRGNVQLIREPNNGAIIVRIEGVSRGAESQTLELGWTVERPSDNGGGRINASGIGSNSNQRRDVANQAERIGAAFSPEEAIRVCEEGVREQAGSRLGTGDLEFRNARIDNSPERQDWVVGAFAFLGRNRSEVVYRFSCSVDFAGGRVRSVQFDQAAGDAYASVPPRVPSPVEAAVLSCQHAIQARLDRSGYSNVSFVSIDLDRRPGRNDWVVGNARAERGDRPARLDFSCRINLNTGNVRTLNVTRR